MAAEHAGRQGHRGLHATPSAPRVPALSQADRPSNPTDLDLHLVVDNYATHKTPAVKRWLKAHPRFHLHFTPTSASWLNMVERFFAEITRNRIRRGVFKSVAELKSAVMEYLENHNADPKPFIWTKSAGEILEKVARAKQALESQH
jgi:DDE superfamily endonuclease